MEGAASHHSYNPHGAGDAADDDDAADGSTRGWCGRKRASKLSDARRLQRRLAGLHKALMAKRALLAKTQFRWERLVRASIELDAVAEGRVPPRAPRSRGASQYWGTDGDVAGGTGAPPAAGVPQPLLLSCVPEALQDAAHTALWRWRIHVAPTFYIILAVLAEAMSLLLSEYAGRCGCA